MQQIYSQIPQKTGCKQCGECCGNIIVTKLEMQNIMTYCEANKLSFTHPVEFIPTHNNQVTFNIKMGASCPLLLQDNKCSIYPVRPLICRLYGTVYSLDCVPQDRMSQADKRKYPLTESQANRLMRQTKEAWL